MARRRTTPIDRLRVVHGGLNRRRRKRLDQTLNWIIVFLLTLFAGLGLWLFEGSNLLPAHDGDRVVTSNSFDIRPGVSTPGANAVSAETLAGPLPATQHGARAPKQVRSATAGGHFSICHTGGGTNCVVDGDTAWIDGVKVRVADIDAPETHPPRCDSEADLGNHATAGLLNCSMRVRSTSSRSTAIGTAMGERCGLSAATGNRSAASSSAKGWHAGMAMGVGRGADPRELEPCQRGTCMSHASRLRSRLIA